MGIGPRLLQVETDSIRRKAPVELYLLRREFTAPCPFFFFIEEAFKRSGQLTLQLEAREFEDMPYEVTSIHFSVTGRCSRSI